MRHHLRYSGARANSWSTPLILFIILITPVRTNSVFRIPDDAPKQISLGDFAEYKIGTIEFYNATHWIYYFNATGTLRWQVLSESNNIAELEVSLKVVGEGSLGINGTFQGIKKVAVDKRLVLTVNVSSREAKYIGQDIGCVPFWIDKMPSKGQRIPMFKNDGEMLYGEVILVGDRDTEWGKWKTRLVYLQVVNPDPYNAINFVGTYDWYSGLALALLDHGSSNEFEPGAATIELPNGTTLEVIRFGGTPLGKLLDLGLTGTFYLNSTSIRVGPPFEESEIDMEFIMTIGFFTASGIPITYVFS